MVVHELNRNDKSYNFGRIIVPGSDYFIYLSPSRSIDFIELVSVKIKDKTYENKAFIWNRAVVAWCNRLC